MRASIGRPGHFRRLLAIAIIGLGGVLATAPAASADHYAGVDADAGGSCFTAVFWWAGFRFTTDDWRFKVHESGSIRLVCRFASLPASWETYDGVQRQLPRKLTVTTRCDYGTEGIDPSTDGEFRILPNGSATLRCSWPAPTA
jgi:hypothetical protein